MHLAQLLRGSALKLFLAHQEEKDNYTSLLPPEELIVISEGLFQFCLMKWLNTSSLRFSFLVLKAATEWGEGIQQIPYVASSFICWCPPHHCLGGILKSGSLKIEWVLGEKILRLVYKKLN